MMYSFKFFR